MNRSRVSVLLKRSLRELVAMEKAICEEPENAETNPRSCWLLRKKARSKLEDIRWAITLKVTENRKAKEEHANTVNN